MPDDVVYKGWVIEVQSYESDGERWRPKALVVSTHEGGSLYMRSVFASTEVTHDTEAEADAYAVEMAKTWIDDKS